MFPNIYNDKFVNKLLFLIPQIKLIKRTKKKIELDLNIEFGRVVLSSISTRKGRFMEPFLSNSLLIRRDKTHPIVPCHPALGEKISYKGETKKRGLFLI